MSEREIRNIVRSVCVDLDERARRAAQVRIQKVVLPAALGVTLAVSGCSSETDSQTGSLQDVDGGYSSQVDASSEAGGPDPRPAPEYDAPLPDAGMGRPIYAAPLPDAGSTAVMPDASADGRTGEEDAQAAAADAAGASDAAQSDAARSDAAQIDAGPVLEYMAVMPDAGVQVLYMAVVVDSGEPNPTPTPVPLYDAPMPNR